jgi:serine/threonine-protein kinase
MHRNQVVGMAEVSAWMHALCPDGLAKKQQLVHLAQQRDQSVPQVLAVETDPDAAEQSHSFSAVVGVRERGAMTPAVRNTIIALASLAVLGAAAVLVALIADIRPGAGITAAEPLVTVTELAPSTEEEMAAMETAAQPVEPPPQPAAMPAPAEVEAPEDTPLKTEEQPDEELEGQPEDETAEAAPVVEQTAQTQPLPEEPAPEEPPQEPIAEQPVDRRPDRAQKSGSVSPPEPMGKSPGPAKEEGTGFVNLATKGGWAEVYYKGKRLGITPGRFELPVGRQRIQLRHLGGDERIYVNVNVRKNRVIKITRKFKR